MASNAEHQRTWYARQKTKGNVYKVTIQDTGDIYIGSTRNSLRKRLWQHRESPREVFRPFIEKYGKTSLHIESLEKLNYHVTDQQLRELEQKWIDKLKPTLNTNSSIAVDRAKHCCKGGVTARGEWFPTRKLLWETYGEVPYGTFKSRLHRGISVEESLKKKISKETSELV